MSFNSSPSYNSSFSPTTIMCLNYRSSFIIFTSFSVTSIILLLPVQVFVLYLGLQRWQRLRSGSSAAAAASHSDIFTYHMVAMEMIGIFGCGLYCCGASVNAPMVKFVGVYLFSVTSNGQVFFHIITCLERHLAVVHPITYLGLRKRGGARIRNITIGFIWLLFVGYLGLILVSNANTVPTLCLLVLSIVVISYCNLSVLHALIRPGPGDGGGDRERVNQSKMKAFHTIMAIMGALLLRFGGHLLVVVIHATLALVEDVKCGVLVSGIWFSLPSSLVLPLLFLHRAGKLLCCKNNTESEGGSD